MAGCGADALALPFARTCLAPDPAQRQTRWPPPVDASRIRGYVSRLCRARILTTEQHPKGYR